MAENNFSCVCLKCKVSFLSTEEADADGEAFCSSCKEKNKEIAQKIDAMIATRRANRAPANPVNVYHEIRKKPKGSVAWMNI